MNDTASAIFGLSPSIRYVAIYLNGELSLAQRSDLSNASESESDKYEELLVNPTILKLAGQRGDIDCGGMDHVIIAYGNFFQLVIPVIDGHVSVAFEKDCNPEDFAERIRALFKL